MSGDARVAAAEAVLRAAGLAGARVTVAGHDRSIAVVSRLEVAHVPAMAELAPRIKALGFRYLTLDITESRP